MKSFTLRAVLAASALAVAAPLVAQPPAWDKEAFWAGAPAGVWERIGVLPQRIDRGRATHCAITHSSGSEELDDTTCRLIEQRFRFEPSRDRSGQPVVSRMVQDHEWSAENITREAQEEPESRPRRRWPF